MRRDVAQAVGGVLARAGRADPLAADAHVAGRAVGSGGAGRRRLDLLVRVVAPRGLRGLGARAHAGDSLSDSSWWPSSLRVASVEVSSPSDRLHERVGRLLVDGGVLVGRQVRDRVPTVLGLRVHAAGVGLPGFDLGLGLGSGSDMCPPGQKPNVEYAVVVPVRRASNTARS